MEGTDYLFIFVAYVVAAAIKGLTGLGFSTSCLPIMALHLDLKVAIPLVIIPSIVSNVSIMRQSGHFAYCLRRFYPLYLATIPGLAAGLLLLVTFEPAVAKAILGLMLILYAGWALSNTAFFLPHAWEKALRMPVGLATGVVNGMTGSQVMPVLPYLLSLGLDKNVFVQAINISFTLSSLVMLAGMNHFDLLSPGTFVTAMLGLIPVLITVRLAGRLRLRLPGELYRRIVLGFLLIMGTTLLLRLVV